jgi:hypothetical protein
MNARYDMPPRLLRADGLPRRVGVEIEFAGIVIDEAAELVRQLYGGEITTKNRFEQMVVGTRFGDFRVEIDSKPLTERRYLGLCERLGLGEKATVAVEDAIEAVARHWIPCEIIAPPIPIDELPDLERLRAALHARQALGTRASVFYGFAFQLNPEVPALEVTSLARHLQAFLLLYDWLVEISEIDLTRRLGPFIQPFSESYRRQILRPDYRPSMSEFIDDYLTSNPTRNRPLDLLPVFAMVDLERVLAVAKQHDKIKARPTFHYRLPNCLVDDPAWSFATEWNRWCEVERLAEDPDRLGRLLRDYAGDPEHDRRAWIRTVASEVGGTAPGVGEGALG